jgi:hypothetical protein
VYEEIARLLAAPINYDDGSYGPILVRLAWHASGTYDAKTGTGGSNGATMRFKPESGHGANAGLDIARSFLESVKSKSVFSHKEPGWLVHSSSHLFWQIDANTLSSEIPMDHLRRPMDSRRRRRYPRDGRSHRPLPARTTRQRLHILPARRTPPRCIRRRSAPPSHLQPHGVQRSRDSRTLRRAQPRSLSPRTLRIRRSLDLHPNLCQQ